MKVRLLLFALPFFAVTLSSSLLISHIGGMDKARIENNLKSVGRKCFVESLYYSRDDNYLFIDANVLLNGLDKRLSSMEDENLDYDFVCNVSKGFVEASIDYSVIRDSKSLFGFSQRLAVRKEY